MIKGGEGAIFIDGVDLVVIITALLSLVGSQDPHVWWWGGGGFYGDMIEKLNGLNFLHHNYTQFI